EPRAGAGAGRDADPAARRRRGSRRRSARGRPPAPVRAERLHVPARGGGVRRAVVWVNDPEAPSFRHRLAAHLPAPAAVGLDCEVAEFPRRRYGARVLRRAARLSEFDLLIVAKFKLEAGERWLVRRRARRIAYDFDDAIYFAKPDGPNDPPD